MALDCEKLGERIKYFRKKNGVSQDRLSELTHVSREFIGYIESASRCPGLETFVDIANALGISTDDLLVDSLEGSVSTADSKIHSLLLDCNSLEETILTETIRSLKVTLYSLGI